MIPIVFITYLKEGDRPFRIHRALTVQLCEVDLLSLSGPGEDQSKVQVCSGNGHVLTIDLTFQSLRGSLRSETELSLSAAAGKPRVKSWSNTHHKVRR